ncbi:MAG: hypothetical protein R2726_06510 [Acidimicrobiales bacterium]
MPDIVVSAAATELEPFNVTRWLRIRFLRPTRSASGSPSRRRRALPKGA